VAEPSASNAGQRPVSRRQALAYGSSLAAALPPHPPRPLRPRHRRRPPAQHLSVSLAQAKRIVAAAEWRARQIGVSMFIVVVDDCGVIKMSSRMDGNSQLNPQEASNDGTDPLRAARWRIRHRSGG
jgi:Haem-degrading